jgi:RimJ/RimL family protein N-acetyltransferase
MKKAILFVKSLMIQLLLPKRKMIRGGKLMSNTLTKIRGFREEEDIERLNIWRSDPAFSKYGLGFVGLPESLEETNLWYSSVREKSKAKIYMITTTIDNRTIGFASIQKIDNRNRNCEIGIGIGDPSDRGKGYGTDARRQLLRYAFIEQNYHRVFGAFASYNMGNLKSHEKLGAKITGKMRRTLFVNGEYHDLYTYYYDKNTFLILDKQRSEGLEGTT